ncbi:hypothetical protein K8I61_00335 [bacterium]|nr:hypothetical protein [bacterium]
MNNEPMIATHNDFDGLVSAALVSIWSGLDAYFFTSPTQVRNAPLDPTDIVCDLPHPMREVRAWFDHHPGNLDEAKKLGLSIGEGAAFEAPSAARVAFDHLRDKAAFPPFMENTVIDADKIDSMDYASIDEWLADSPANLVNRAIYLPTEDFKTARAFMIWLTRRFRDTSVAAIAAMPEITSRLAEYESSKKSFAEIVRKLGRVRGKLLVLDFSDMRSAPRFSRNLAYAVHPEVDALVTVTAQYQQNRKTNDLRVSAALNPFKRQESPPDLASFMEDRGLGGGHPAAAGGIIRSASKDERIKKLDAFLSELADEFGG